MSGPARSCEETDAEVPGRLAIRSTSRSLSEMERHHSTCEAKPLDFWELVLCDGSASGPLNQPQEKADPHREFGRAELLSLQCRPCDPIIRAGTRFFLVWHGSSGTLQVTRKSISARRARTLSSAGGNSRTTRSQPVDQSSLVSASAFQAPKAPAGRPAYIHCR